MRSDKTPPSSSGPPADNSRSGKRRDTAVPSAKDLDQSPPLSGAAPERLGERYRIEELLGEGGMGRVYRAFDEQLGRWVALKLLRPDSSATAERLLFEARSQARVDHAHVCKVYEAGNIDGRPFVAMQYIEGVPLNKAFDGLDLRQKLVIMRQVAEGIHAAHGQGLIHRDLKPSNIMVQSENGGFRAYVLDFGLAREQAAPGVTTTGEVKGTPHYMAPEQVTGEIHTLDPRADVYGLGATLYEGLSGRPMYADSSGLSVLVKVLNEDPEPLRSFDSSLPPEVETIVMKCLEKDPQKRYQSSQELADDIQRYLVGDPLVARPASVFYRLSKRLGKRKVAVLTWTLIAVVAAASALAMTTYFRIKDRDHLADLFRQEVKLIETTMDHAYTSPFHDISEEKGRVRQMLAKIENRVDRLGRRARGPGNFALGQAYMHLEDYEQARTHLQTAWDSGYQESAVAYALGRVMGELYLQALRRSDYLEDEAEREAHRRSIEREFRQKALDFLLLGREDLQVDSPELPEALILLWEGRHQEALSKAEQAHRKMPYSYEPTRITGDIYVAIGDQHRRQGENELASAAFDKAEEAYRSALVNGRSDPRVHLGLCALGQPRVEMQLYGEGGSLAPLLEKSLRNCRRVIEIDPERAEAHQRLAALYYRQGESEMFRGEDPSASARKAIEAADRALRRRGDDIYAYTSKGLALYLLADAQMRFTREDPTPYHQRARDAFEQAIAINPNHAPARSSLGYTYTRQAVYEKNHGRDPVPSLRQAIQELERALQVRPEFTYAYDNLGTAYLTWARWKWWRGEDPAEELARAKAAFARAAETNPQYVYAYYSQADAFLFQAEVDFKNGEDPSAALATSRDFLARALDINPEETDFFLLRGKAAIVEGRWAMQQGRDPNAAFDRAEQDIQRALELYSVVAEYVLAAAEVDFWRAVWQVESGRPAAASLARALEQAEQAVDLQPAEAKGYLQRGKLYLLRAETAASSPRRAEARRRAEDDLQHAIEINPVFENLCAPWFARLRNQGA